MPDPATSPAVPSEVWGLWNDQGGEDEGYWMPTLDDTPFGTANLVSFSEGAARDAARYLNERHGLILKPVRIK